MKLIRFSSIDGNSNAYWGLFIVLAVLILAGMGSSYYMEHHGHYVTGMTNQIVWGLPHVFAVFLIVAASGALNVASIASVFNKKAYKPLARLSGVLAIALLAGGLMILVLDLGRPDRLLIAATTYNFKSIFAWNMILYSGFVGLVGIYIWTMMDQTVNQFNRVVGFAAFIWRLLLTTGTGSIFGFLVARQGYDAAIMAPMFIMMSFAFGLAIFILVLFTAYNGTDRELGDAIVNRLRNLLGVFIAAVLYFVLVYHLTNLYATEHHGVEAFILRDGGIFTTMFWLGWVVIGGFLPLLMVYGPFCKKSRKMLGVASVLVILGGLAAMYTIIIGGQAYPLELFPGKEVSSSFFDGVVNGYNPTLPEFMLGVGGVALALIVVHLAVKALHLLPRSLADSVADPHYKD